MSTPAETSHHPPAGADLGPTEIRPRLSRRICLTVVPIVLNVFAVCGISLNPAVIGLAGRISLFAVAVVIAAVLYVVQTRPLIRADATTIHVRNVVGGITVGWSQVAAVVYTGQRPWPHLQLHDGSTVALHAIQRWDRDHAVTATRMLRTFHANAASCGG
jgi:PH (Pleckstrin Homology) domain-containing protein